jgi:hypothetical protein
LGVDVLLGTWIVVAPWVLGYGSSARADVHHLLTGVAVVTLGFDQYTRPRSWQPGAALSLLGLWLLASGTVLDYSTVVDRSLLVWHDAIVGVLVVVAGMANAASAIARSR